MNAKPKLLIIINRLVISGQTPDVISTAWHLKNEFEIKIVYGEKQADEAEALHLLGIFSGLDTKKIPTLKKTISLLDDLKAFFFLYRNIKYNNYDIVHTHGSKAGFLGRIAAYFAGTETIIHTYHGNIFQGYFNQLTTRAIITIERLLGRFTDACVVLSKQQVNEIVEKYSIIPKKKAALIPLGFDIKAYQTNDCTMKWTKKFKNYQSKKIIAIIGRIVPIKDHLFFFKVAEALLKRRKDVIFLVVGDGSEKPKLQSYLSTKNIAFSEEVGSDASIIFASWQTDMISLFNYINIVTLTSKNEGTPLSLIEAQYFRKPVVALDAGGVKDTFIDNETGFLVRSHSIKEMADKIELLLEDEVLAKRMGERGHAFVEQHFAKEKEVSAHRNLYNRYNTKHQ